MEEECFCTPLVILGPISDFPFAIIVKPLVWPFVTTKSPGEPLANEDGPACMDRSGEVDKGRIRSESVSFIIF